ncbi:ABC transporter permease [Fulvitalea axinellae]|uniref:ABC transporter permease n=1 Tax=Fulvitalea axinellae TaxID=1182444 RepID=A0AAU9D0L0_9BACT|nr:ABC transporter permease [Fulvitalea axinellae]
MKFESFVSSRITRADSGSFSSTVNKIAVGSIAMGLALMILSFLILFGFQDTIRDKVISFNGELQVVKYSSNNSYKEEPISLLNPLSERPENFSEISGEFPFAHKPGLIKTEEDVSGIVLKAVDSTYKDSPFMTNMTEGRFVEFSGTKRSTDMVISERLANKLGLGVGDTMLVYFIQNPPRPRKMIITGLYNTGLAEFDERFALGDIRLIRRLNHWADTLAGGVEVHLNRFDETNKAQITLLDSLGYNLYVSSILDTHSDIFEWLDMLNVNVIVFLSLILAVACFNMMSIILILIMERTQMIGVLKALGASNRLIRRIFRHNGMRLIGKGLLWGNVIGLGLCALQYFFRIIPLDPESYYMSYVPISWSFVTIVALNIGTFLLVTSVLFIPTAIISKISPIKSIRFD